MTFKEIKELIDVINNSNLAEFKIKKEDFELSIRTDKYEKAKGQNQQYVATQQPILAQPATVASPVPLLNQAPAALAPVVAANGEVAEKKEEVVDYLTIKSPIVGTFYRSPSPDKGAYVKVGDVVEAGDVVCIIEAMKLFNEIESEISGKIVKVLTEDAQPVEYDQPLFLVDPNG